MKKALRHVTDASGSRSTRHWIHSTKAGPAPESTARAVLFVYPEPLDLRGRTRLLIWGDEDLDARDLTELYEYCLENFPESQYEILQLI